MKKILVILIIAALAGESFAQGLLRRNNTLLTNRVPAPAAETGATPTTKTSDPGASKVDVGGRSIEFNGAALDIVLMVYGNLVGKTVLKDPQAPAATITLQPKQGQDLTDEDKILAIETVLEMNGIHLEPYGEKFVRALPRSNVRKDGIPLIMDPDTELGESTKVVSLMLTFRNIALDEAQKALEGLKSDKGVLNVFERTSSILVTDTEMNINRMREIAKTIDVPTPVTENVFIRQIKNAAAQDIKTALEAIVQESQKELEKQGQKANQVQRHTPQPISPRTLLGRNQQNQPAAPTANESLVTSVSDADRGMIRGKVLILSDERSNKLIIVTSKANMDFFDKVIEQLDIETTPDTVVKVYRLKYADSEDVSDMINDLIGNAASSKSSSKGSQNANSKNASTTKVNTTTGSSTTAKTTANQRTGEAKAGELSKENTTVLADKRINGLVVMTNKELVPVIEQIIESMDIKLSQVLIETCIIEVGLGDNLTTGLDWVHGLKGNESDGYTQAMSGGGDMSKVLSSTNAVKIVSNALKPMGGAGFSYALYDKGMKLGAIIKASKDDSRAKYLASPVIMTVDNKEATIEATESRKFYSGSTSNGSYGSTSVSYNYSDKDLGIKIKVTPKINPNGTVMLQVEEEYSQIGSGQSVLVSSGSNSGSPSKENIDTALTRKMSADVILENAQTVVLGGLTEKSVIEKESGIPILKDIPYIGKYLFGSTSYDESRKELLVFMTPYVMNDAADAEMKAKQLKSALSDARPWDDNGWSSSELADPVSQKEQLRRQSEEWKKQDEEHAAALAIEKAKLDRAVELGQRAIDEKKQKESEDAARAEREAEIREENASLLEELKDE